MLQQAFDEKLDVHAFAQYFDLLNRYRPSRRCSLAAAKVVSSLAPLCLPGPRELWSILVDHKKVWEDLQPRDVSSALDKYLRRYVPEVLLFDAFPERILRGIPVPDRIGTSRIQLLLVLPAVAAALWLGRQILTAKHDYSLDQWHSHFASREDARAWKNAEVKVHLLSAYAAMKSILSEAIDFFASMECDGDNRFSELCTNIHLGIATWDSKQGQSLEYMVLVAPEALDEWSQYLWKPQRLLTTFSRYYRCVAVPRFHAPDRKHHPNVGEAILTHQMYASFHLSWSSLTSDLRLRPVDEGMYFSLYYHFWKLRQQQTASSHLQCRSVLLQKRSPADPFASSFRGFNLVLLRYLSSISKLDSNLPATKSFVKSALVAHFEMNHRVLGFYVLDKERPWFNNDFFDIVYSFHTRYAATDGYFIDILPSPLQRSTGLLLFSFLVTGLEAKTPSLWARGLLSSWSWR